MLVALAILFPALMLLGILGMERVERPLDQFQVRTDLERFLASDELDDHPEFVEQFVADGYRTTLRRYWRHHEPARSRTTGFRRARRPVPSATVVAVPLANPAESGTHVAGA
jgi:hypothetical protein